MRKPSFILILFCWIQTKALCQQWVNQKISGVCEISFPVIPKKSDTLGMTFYHSETDSVLYFVQTQAFPQNLRLRGDKKIDSIFFNDFSEGILKASNGKLLNKEYISIGSIKGVRVEYSADQPNLADLRFVQVFAFSNQIIVQHFWTLNEFRNETENQRMKYFSSIVFTKNVQEN